MSGAAHRAVAPGPDWGRREVQVQVSPDPNHPEGGHAIISIEGVGGPLQDARFGLLREGWAKNVLGPEGWQVGAALLTPDRVVATAHWVRLFVGPSVVDHLESGPLFLRLPAARVEAALFWPDIPPLYGGSNDTISVKPRGRAAPAPAPPSPPPPDPDATLRMRAPPAPPPPAPMPRLVEPEPPLLRSSRGWLWLVLLLLVLAGAGAGGWWWWTGQQEGAPPLAIAAPEAPPEPAIEELPDSAREHAPPRQLAPSQAPAGLEGLSVAEVVAQARSSAEVAQEAARRYQRGRYDDALLLWEAAAQAGDAASLTRLGRLYDPVTFQPDRPFRAPDPRQAARYYREAANRGDAGVAQPRAALRRWLEDRAREGDFNAPLTLRDFWP